MKNVKIVLVIGVLLGACGQENSSVDMAEVTTPLANIQFDDGRTLDIVSTKLEDGNTAITYLAKGPFGTKPFEELGRAEMDGINPIKLLKKVAPNEPISQKLLDLSNVIDFDADSRKPIKSLTQDEEERITLGYVPGQDFTTALSQGSLGSGCPWQTFAGSSGGSGPMCPYNGGNQRWCFGNVGGMWYDFSTTRTDSGYNTVCVDEERVPNGKARYVTKITSAMSGNLQNEWTHYVGKGSWLQEYTKFHQTCIWGIWCTVPAAGLRYDVHSDDQVWFHAGGRWWKQ